MTLVTDFACIAEAVGHYLQYGFSTKLEGDGYRVMVNQLGKTILIQREAFLTVKVTELS